MQTCIRNQDQKTTWLPIFLLINAWSFVSKIDELSIFLYINNVSFAGYCLDCRDRVNSRGGGVCLYVSNTIYNKCLLWDFENTDYECMWIWLRPNRPPRPLSSITVCVVYKAPDRDVHEQRDLNEYLSCSINSIHNKFSHCCILVLSDFSRSNTSIVRVSQNLRQIVSKPTRNKVILDLIFTDFHKFYSVPEMFAPLGLSDHNVVVCSPLLACRKFNNTSKNKNVKWAVR